MPLAPVVVVVAGGDPEPAANLDLPAAPAFVIAADAGVDRALALGLEVDLAVGDLDSVSPGGLVAVRAAGGRVEVHPPDKDATDLALALDAALAHGAARVLVVGGAGGRLDHFLANALLLAHEAYASVQVDAVLAGARVAVVRERRRLSGAAGQLVSLLPVGGPAVGVRTEGLRYPLRAEDLAPGDSRGVSNVFLGSEAEVTLRRGVLLAVQPVLPPGGP